MGERELERAGVDDHRDVPRRVPEDAFHLAPKVLEALEQVSGHVGVARLVPRGKRHRLRLNPGHGLIFRHVRGGTYAGLAAVCATLALAGGASAQETDVGSFD